MKRTYHVGVPSGVGGCAWTEIVHQWETMAEAWYRRLKGPPNDGTKFGTLALPRWMLTSVKLWDSVITSRARICVFPSIRSSFILCASWSSLFSPICQIDRFCCINENVRDISSSQGYYRKPVVLKLTNWFRYLGQVLVPSRSNGQRSFPFLWIMVLFSPSQIDEFYWEGHEHETI